MDIKYVMINHSFPIIFLAMFNHKDFSGVGNITSAGFLRIRSNSGYIQIETYGESTSLGKRPDAEDAKLIQFFLNK